MQSPQVDRSVEEYLAGRIAPPLQTIVGARLARVIYWCADERGLEFISNPFFETTGEVELQFANGVNIYLTWRQNAITFGDNAVWVHTEPGRIAEIYAPCEADEMPLWQPLIGTTLQRVEVLSWGNEVRVVRVSFPQGNVFIGVGLVLQSDDDVFVRSEADFSRWPRAEEGIVIWSCE